MIFSQTGYLLRQAAQGLRKKIGFVSSVVITMGVVLGVLLCVSTLAYLLLVKPLPYEDQDRLYRVDHIRVNKQGDRLIPAFTFPGIMHLYENQDVFSDAALISYGNDVISSAINQPAVSIGYITPEWFKLFDGRFTLGRDFGENEAVNTNHPVAILSYKTWQKEFAGDPKILSNSLDISGITYKIVGVVAESFVEPKIHGIRHETGVWLPWDYTFATLGRDKWRWTNRGLAFVGKLKGNTTEEQAQQTIEPLVNDKWQENGTGLDFFNGAHIEIEMSSFKNIILGDSRGTIYLLLAGALGLVFIAFTNIANLFVSRAAEQKQTLAIHAAVGAKESQLFYTLLAESSLLMILSILLAFVIAVGGFWLVQQNLATVLPRVDELSVDFFTFGIATFISISFAFLFAYLGRNTIKYKALNSLLQSSGKGTGVQVSKRLRRLLIISQIGIATILVFANISLLQKAVQTINEPLGFTVDNTTYLTLSYAARKRPSFDEVAPIVAEIRKKLIQLPEIKSISQSVSPLRNPNTMLISFGASEKKLLVRGKNIDVDYFKLIGQRLREGRYFSNEEYVNRSKIAIINDVLADKITTDGSALGNIKLNDESTVTIIGVVKGVKMPGESEVKMRLFFPANLGLTHFVIKLHKNQSLTRDKVGKLLREVSSMWSVWTLESLEDNVNQRLFAQITTAVTTAVLTLITFFLAGVGLYGILSYTTQMRRFEIGTRMAIGAKRKDLIRLVVSDYFRAISEGIAVGILVLFILAYILNDQIQEFYSELYSGQSVINLFVTLILIITIGLYACYVPLRQYINNPVINSLRGSE